jgi:hypothetical protein
MQAAETELQLASQQPEVCTRGLGAFQRHGTVSQSFLTVDIRLLKQSIVNGPEGSSLSKGLSDNEFYPDLVQSRRSLTNFIEIRTS